MRCFVFPPKYLSVNLPSTSILSKVDVSFYLLTWSLKVVIFYALVLLILGNKEAKEESSLPTINEEHCCIKGRIQKGASSADSKENVKIEMKPEGNTDEVVLLHLSRT